MNSDEYIDKLEQHLARTREEISGLMGLIEASNHRVGRLQRLCTELLSMMSEIAPEQVAKRRQALLTLAESTPESDEDFSRFLSRMLRDVK